VSIELRPATEAAIRNFATWQYEPPYDVYGIAESPDEAVTYFLQSEIRCHTLWDGSELVGYATFGKDAQVPGGDYGVEGIDIGLGIEPDRTGLGNGHRFVAAVVAYASATFEHQELRVTIGAGNARALRVWSDAGFAEKSSFATSRIILGSNEFVVLSLDQHNADWE
jgi:[ribosomal protein S18]-alanine N-acetyltransferase